MNREQNQTWISQALDLITLAADSHRLDLQTRISGGLGEGIVGPRGLDATLALSRDLDTLERLQRDAAALLDRRSLRLLPSATGLYPTAS